MNIGGVTYLFAFAAYLVLATLLVFPGVVVPRGYGLFLPVLHQWFGRAWLVLLN